MDFLSPSSGCVGSAACLRSRTTFPGEMDQRGTGGRLAQPGHLGLGTCKRAARAPVQLLSCSEAAAAEGRLSLAMLSSTVPQAGWDPAAGSRYGVTGTGLASRSRSSEGWRGCWGHQCLCRSVRRCPTRSFTEGVISLDRGVGRASVLTQQPLQECVNAEWESCSGEEIII